MDNVAITIFGLNIEAVRTAALTYENTVIAPGWKPSPFAIVSAFPGMDSYLKKRRRKVMKLRGCAEIDAERELRESFAMIYADDSADHDLLSFIANDTYKKRLEHFDRELARIDKLLRIYRWKSEPDDPDRITDADIAHAKETPISELVEIKRRDNMILCPFHNERTPSCKVFKDNHWYCFGACQRGGDVIDLFMGIENLDFISAVKRLVGK